MGQGEGGDEGRGEGGGEGGDKGGGEDGVEGKEARAAGRKNACGKKEHMEKKGLKK